MILADTSIWVDHFRRRDVALSQQLQESNISTHPFIVAELALGNLPDRRNALVLLDRLPAVKVAQLTEVRRMVETRSLFQRGIGLIDANLIASALITPYTLLWSRDKRLQEIAESLGLSAPMS